MKSKKWKVARNVAICLLWAFLLSSMVFIDGVHIRGRKPSAAMSDEERLQAAAESRAYWDAFIERRNAAGRESLIKAVFADIGEKERIRLANEGVLKIEVRKERGANERE